MQPSTYLDARSGLSQDERALWRLEEAAKRITYRNGRIVISRECRIPVLRELARMVIG